MSEVPFTEGLKSGECNGLIGTVPPTWTSTVPAISTNNYCPSPLIITLVSLRVIQSLERSTIFTFFTQFCSDETISAKMPQKPIYD